MATALRLPHAKPLASLPPEPPRRVEEFFPAVASYFGVARDAAHPRYDEILYAVRRPLSESVFERVLAYAGHRGAADGDAASSGERPVKDVDAALRACRYPDVAPLARLADRGLDLRTASAVLHFYNPAYPFYDVASLAALRRLGVDVPLRSALDADGLAAYRRHVDVVQEYKERIHWAYVPECHYYLTRVIEGALWGMGATMGALGA